MRLIDADAFKKVLSAHEMQHDKRRSFDDYSCGAANAYEYACDLLDEAPTIDRPQGEWEHWGSPFSDDSIANSIVCSLCKARYVEIEDEVFNFCPNCGASMVANDEQVTGKLNSEIEKSKSEIVPDYRDGWRLKEGDEK